LGSFRVQADMTIFTGLLFFTYMLS